MNQNSTEAYMNDKISVKATEGSMHADVGWFAFDRLWYEGYFLPNWVLKIPYELFCDGVHLYFAVMAVVLAAMLKYYCCQNREYKFCYNMLFFNVLLTALLPPLHYQTITVVDIFSLIGIPAAIPKNIALYNLILTSYVMIVFALNSYRIVFSPKKSDFFIYSVTAGVYILCLLLTLFLNFLRSLYDELDARCHFNLLLTLEIAYCHQTLYMLGFLLCAYVIPMFILLAIHFKISKALKTDAAAANVDNVMGRFKILHLDKIIRVSKHTFIRLSYRMALVFILANIPFVMFGLLYTIHCKLNYYYVGFAACLETVTRWSGILYPYICLKTLFRNGRCKHFMHDAFQNFWRREPPLRLRFKKPVAKKEKSHPAERRCFSCPEILNVRTEAETEII
ncbi:hypothetical protein CEXT_631211 [Caerostris extrusa]|uniref:G-protein coupled receptors family 1 profile domain-containing protein n=1 Tax=Caerostris extrusa TaxID=172846 RepID=A0AAV4NR66_CAEEX|nr:hypothetical protein CEXT_631211 [Caerostris extrusa]